MYALMVEWFSSQRRVQEAHKLIEQMRERGIVLSPYVDAEMVRETYAAVGAVPPNAPSNDVAGGGEDEIEEGEGLRLFTGEITAHEAGLAKIWKPSRRHRSWARSG